MKTGRYIPYEDVVYRLDGYVIDDIDEAFYPMFDFTDDGYTTLDGDDGYMECHSHPLIVQCFPANTLTLNDAQKEVLLNGYQNFLQNK